MSIMQQKAIQVRDMAFIALFTAMICAVAPISFAIGPIPLSFATLAVYLAVGALGWKNGVISVLLYVALGAMGLPVFTNFEGGFHKIVGVTGGYIIGYIPCALAIGIVVEVFRKKFFSYIFGMVIGTVLLYTCGTAWFVIQTGNSLAVSLGLCVTPFLIGDTIKIILACMIVPQLQNALARVMQN